MSSGKEAWCELVKRYADGRSICNCRQAYYTACGHGIIQIDGQWEKRTDMLVCKYGCEANLSIAKEEIGRRALAEIMG